ncbi:phosphatase ImpM (plasmid) [Sinorhizobium americanum CCGM7]|uniref:type VI secretion system-associated protein TagF n=1 Tax=Sinorhizobium americanum TaxID=194963 RepID=UPI0004D91789|nr:type VI secretion system-associated protein TagF [Sinorhizobium americanum]APG87622.1 phosphatase ImpM [Sinorhizobium americanum CCGM7]
MRQTSDIKAAEADRIGFFGKLPTHGDFVSTGIDHTLQRELDDWLQAGLRACQDRLGSRWRDAFHAMPAWRFIVERGRWGPATIAGVLLPSADRVGRSFPLVIAAQLHSFDDHPRQLYLDSPWFTAAEALAETSLARDFDIGTFMANLKRLRMPHAPESAIAGRFASLGRDSSSLWWKTDAAGRDAKGFRTASPPAPADFLRLVESAAGAAESAGQEAPGGEMRSIEAAPGHAAAESEVAAPIPEAAPPPATFLGIAHSHATHPGTRLALNADALIASDPDRLFAVADGIGDEPAAAEASRITIAVLADGCGHDSLDEAIKNIKGKLGRAHGLLQSIASSASRQVPAASVAVLCIRGDRYAVIWAGDVRCYLLRNGLMRSLTRDHVEIGMKRRLTRYLGADRQLVPETLIDRVEAGDRFLLCSGSLIRVLGERAVAEALLDTDLERAAEALVQDALIGNARDNLSAIVIDAVQR